MKVYLVEEYSPDYKFESDSVVVALTPDACYRLEKAGVKYSIIEEHYDEAELRASEDEYSKLQFQWLDKLDEFLQENVKEFRELNLKLGTIYYYFLKTNLLDPIYIKCYSLNKLLEATKPTSVTFVSGIPGETPLDFRLLDAGISYYSQVIPLVCSKHSVPLSSVFLKDGKTKLTEKTRAKSDSVLMSVFPRVKSTLAASAIVRRLYYWMRLANKFLHGGRSRQLNQAKINIFLVKLTHIRAEFIFEALFKGYKVFSLSDNSISKYSYFGANKYLDLTKEKSRTKVLANNLWENAANQLAGSDVINSFNDTCRLDVSKIVLPRLRYFVTSVCPEILSYFKAFTEFYKKDKIDFVVTAHAWILMEFAAIAAAGRGNNAKSVHFQHGEGVFNSQFLNAFELIHYDYFIASNNEAKEYFALQCRKDNIPTKLYGSDDRLLHIKKIYNLRQTGKDNIKRNRIIYLPNIFFIDQYRLDGAYYPATWYYEFWKSLLQYLASRTEYTFVWKCFPQYEAMYNPIPDYIRDSHFSNIEIATNPFTEHLLTADKVICDFPSTGFYEAIIAGVPSMSLYYRNLKVRESALNYFGRLLQPFSDVPEAIKHIEEFLNSPPEQYRTTIEMEESSFLAVLENIKKGG